MPRGGVLAIAPGRVRPFATPATAKPIGAAVRAVRQAMMPPLLIRSLRAYEPARPRAGTSKFALQPNGLGGARDVGRAPCLVMGAMLGHGRGVMAMDASRARPHTDPARPLAVTGCAMYPADVGTAKSQRSPCLRRFGSACSDGLCSGLRLAEASGLN